MTAQDPAEFTVQLLSPAYGGESLGRLPDGRAVFVPFTLPGETAHVRLVEEHRRHARAALLQIIFRRPRHLLIVLFPTGFLRSFRSFAQEMNLSSVVALRSPKVDSPKNGFR